MEQEEDDSDDAEEGSEDDENDSWGGELSRRSAEAPKVRAKSTAAAPEAAPNSGKRAKPGGRK